VQVDRRRGIEDVVAPIVEGPEYIPESRDRAASPGTRRPGTRRPPRVPALECLRVPPGPPVPGGSRGSAPRPSCRSLPDGSRLGAPSMRRSSAAKFLDSGAARPPSHSESGSAMCRGRLPPAPIYMPMLAMVGGRHASAKKTRGCSTAGAF
jgi:hypothetical protein